MSRRSLISSLVLCLAFGAWSAPAGGAPDGAPVTSALVTLAGPSVAQEYVRLAGVPRDAAEVAQRAASLRGALADADDGLRARQAPVIAAAERLGVDVVSRYTAAANGLLVHATGPQLESLASVPGVVYIEPALIVRPALAASVPLVGAERLMSGAGYEAAARGAERIDDTWAGEPLFPTAKVIGGYDFVGPRYSPPRACTQQLRLQGICVPERRPDPDPLDQDEHFGGHGTAVAGIVAGQAAGALAPGMAPGAKLVALKIFGAPLRKDLVDEEADAVVDAIDWCVRVNLGLEDRGTVPVDPPHVDVVTMSLGEPFAQASRMFDQVVQSAHDVGIIVVASAGNDGDVPFAVGSPSASPAILSVASSEVSLRNLYVAVRAGDMVDNHSATEGALGPFLLHTGPVDAPLADLGRGCGEPEVDVAAKVALVERGDCAYRDKVLFAQDAGALAVLVYPDEGTEREIMRGDGTGVRVPAVMIDRAPGVALSEELAAGSAATVRLDIEQSDVDRISSHSARGPSRNGALKPDLTAPGSQIVTARRGTGTSGASFNGTSAAAPFVAGAAALLHQRNRNEGLGLAADDLAALLVNTARPRVHAGGAPRAPVPVARQGAGRLDVLAAGTTETIVRAGDVASIGFGILAVPERTTRQQSVTVRNLSPAPARYRLAARLRDPADEGHGVTVTVPEILEVPAGETRTTTVHLDLDPAVLRPWTLRGVQQVEAQTVTTLEVDGFVSVDLVDAAGSEVAGAVGASLPFHVLPRPASEVSSTGFRQGREPVPGPATWDNDGAVAGDVELFVVPWGGQDEDPDEPEVLYELDVRHVGVRVVGPPAVAEPVLSVAVSLYEPSPLPFATSLEIYLDTDRNGAVDHRLRTVTELGLNGTGSDRNMFVAAAPWDPGAGEPAGEETAVGLYAYDVHSRLARLDVPLSAIGLDAPAPLAFYVVHRGVMEDWLRAVKTDVLPDGALAFGGPRFSFDPAALAWQPETWSFSVEPNGDRRVAAVPGDGQVRPALLALYPDNDHAPADGQAQVLAARPAPPKANYLPLLHRGIALRPLPREAALIQGSLDALEGLERLRVVYDITDYGDPANSAQRVYDFDYFVHRLMEGWSTHIVTRFREAGAGSDRVQIRFGDWGYIRIRNNWQCGPIEWYMYTWPELTARLRREIPLWGWQITQEGPNAEGRPVAKLTNTSARDGYSFYAEVDLEWGVMHRFSITEVATFEREVFWFKDFNDPTVHVQPPGLRPCP